MNQVAVEVVNSRRDPTSVVSLDYGRALRGVERRYILKYMLSVGKRVCRGEEGYIECR